MRWLRVVINLATNSPTISRDLQRTRRIPITPTNLSTAPNPNRLRCEGHYAITSAR